MITVCGEGVVDLVEEDGGRFRACPGGSPLNVAVGLARLGVATSMMARLSRTGFGPLLRDHLTGNGVSPRDVVEAGEPASLAVVRPDARGQATYDFYVEGTGDWLWRDGELPDHLAGDVVCLHTGSLASWTDPGATRIRELLERERARRRVTLSYDPNVRPALMGDPGAAARRVEDLVRLVDVVRASDEDLRWLHPGHDVSDVAARWAGAGPRLVVVTCGERGAFAVSSAGVRARRPARPVPVVDTVGAGDAFTAALLAGLLEAGALGRDGRAALAGLDTPALERILDRCCLAAALTCSRAGADPPTREELLRYRQP